MSAVGLCKYNSPVQNYWIDDIHASVLKELSCLADLHPSLGILNFPSNGLTFPCRMTRVIWISLETPQDPFADDIFIPSFQEHLDLFGMLFTEIIGLALICFDVIQLP